MSGPLAGGADPPQEASISVMIGPFGEDGLHGPSITEIVEREGFALVPARAGLPSAGMMLTSFWRALFATAPETSGSRLRREMMACRRERESANQGPAFGGR